VASFAQLLDLIKPYRIYMKSKRLLFLTVLCSVMLTVSAQSTYTVIKVYGGIQYKSSKKPMAQGDVFTPAEPLIFGNTDSKAAVVNKEKGRFMITPPISGKLEAQPNFVPAMSNISTRAGLINNTIELKNHFSGNYLIINKVKIKISPSVYPMNDTSFFYLTYTYKDEKINKKLAFVSDSLIIDRQSLFTIDGRPIPDPDIKEMKLYYLSGNKSVFISEFYPVFPELSTFKAETVILLNELSGLTYNQKLDEILAYFNEWYGKPNSENVKEWLKTEFNLTPDK